MSTHRTAGQSWRSDYKRRLSEAGITDSIALNRATAREVLTDRRTELIDVLSNEDVDSVGALAERVERDTGQVSKDLRRLYEAGIVEYEKEGRRKRPVLTHSTILVEPVMYDGQVTGE